MEMHRQNLIKFIFNKSLLLSTNAATLFDVYIGSVFGVFLPLESARTRTLARAYFQSKRLHVEPSTSSWFTHNLGFWLLQLQFSRVCCACVGYVDFLLYFEMTKCNKRRTKAPLSKHMSVAPWSNYQETILPLALSLASLAQPPSLCLPLFLTAFLSLRVHLTGLNNEKNIINLHTYY